MKGEKPPAPTRGVNKQSAVADGGDDGDVDEDVVAGDAAAASPADLVPRTDIRFAATAASDIYVQFLVL